MVDIRPFRAITYDVERIGDLSKVIAPPYDVISPELQDELYARHPNNVVRVELNRHEPGDAELASYERAASLLSEWMKGGVLRLEGEPAYYVLSQTFTGPDGVERTRTGFFGRARLTRFGEGPILPHERTLKGPKIDRLRLFRATGTNLSPIFGMYPDPDQAVLRELDRVRKGPPAMEATMEGVKNRVWRVFEPDHVARIEAALAPKKLYIADGHHRYETGLAYRDERRREGGASGEDPAYESILMFSAAMEDPGMVVFPTHRLVRGLQPFDPTAFEARIATFFTVAEAPRDVPAARRALDQAGLRGNAYLMVTRSKPSLITLRPDAPLAEVEALPKHPAVRKLDVTVLHALILEHILGISKEDQATQKNLRYAKDDGQAFRSPSEDPDVQIAFLLNPTKIAEVALVSDAGEVMPQKSTFFYPKVPSGLVLYPLD